MAAQQRFPWVPVSAAVAFLVICAVAWLQVPSGEQSSGSRANLPVLGLAQIGSEVSGDLLKEQLAAYDPSPLFIPSEMNSGDPALPEGVRPSARGPFAALPPIFVKDGSLQFPAPVKIPDGSVEGLRLTERPESPMVMARGELTRAVLPGRSARVEVAAVEDGHAVLTLNIPTTDELPAVDWQPLELMGAVTRSGLAGNLVVTTSSGFSEIDDYFMLEVREKLRVGSRLKAGFYTFGIGP